MKLVYSLVLFLCISFNAVCQFTPESDPHRGFYLDHFLRFFSGTNTVDTSRSILGVDKDFDGIFEKEDAVLQYACENHITYLAMYDMHRTIGTNKTIWNENTNQFENPEKHLCRFIEKARTRYGVTQIGAVGGSSNFFDSLSTYLDRYPVTAPIQLSDEVKASPHFNRTLASVETNSYRTREEQQAGEYLKQCLRIMNFNSTNACQSDIDVINIEYEFWGDCSGTFSDFTEITESMKALKDSYNASHPDNPMITEAYLAFLYYCTGIAQVVQTIDGCSNCTPCPTCSNPHEPLIDRVLYSILQSHPYNFSWSEQNYFEQSVTQDSTDYHPMLYSESMNYGGGYDFLGLWFTQAPTNTIFFSEEYYFYHWLTFSGSALGTPRQNNVQAGGVHWFSQSYMVGHLDDPKVIQTPGPFCSAGDSTLIILDYYGPDEPGTDYTFSITRDSDGAIVYPRNGIPMTGVSISTIANPAYRSINFKDTLLFPKCYLPNGEYTGTISLSYNHSTGCNYVSTTKIIVSPSPEIQLIGDSIFCEGDRTFLSAPTGGSYVWFRNGEVIPGATTSTLSVSADGDYHCVVSGTTCNGTSNTIHITVHPNPTASLNVTCNGNGTYTLKTDHENANSSSIDLTGNAGVTYLWSTGATTDQITVPIPNSTDRIYVTITDQYSGCTRLRHISLLATPNTAIVPSITVNTVPSSSCASDGSLTAVAGNVVGTVEYFWSNGATTQTINNLPPGVYTVAMTLYANPCSAYSTATLGTLPTSAPVITPSIIDATCNNKNDGSIQLSISGGNPPFSFNWKNIPNENGYDPYTQNQSNLYSGTYTLNLTDVNGCHFTFIYDVDYNNTIPRANYTATAVTGCGTSNNGSATLNVTSGNGPYQYQWFDPANQTSATAVNLFAGTVPVNITDANGCISTYNVRIPSEEIAIETSVIDSTVLNPTCSGATDANIYLNVTGGTEPYSVNSPWNIDSNLIYLENLGDTSINLVITDDNGCSIQRSFTITEPVFQLSTQATASTCIGCPNGKLLLNQTGGVPPYTYQWTPNVGNLSGDTIINLTSGIYTICITDLNNCTICTTDTILEDPTSITDLNGRNELLLYPNPSSGEFTILSDELENKIFETIILDIDGRIIYKNSELTGVSNQLKLNLENGMYIITISHDQKSFRKIFTIMK
jgi:hypothetical protein